MKIKRFALASAGLCAALALTACGGGSNEEAINTNDMSTENLVVETTNLTELPIETPTPEPVVNTAPPLPVAPTPDLTAEEQTQEDAEATGMTARVSRDEAGSGEEAAKPVK